MEFILRGGKSSRDIYWNMAGWMRGFTGTLELVDGKQRVEAALAFMRGEVVVFNKYTAADFEGHLHFSCSFTFHVNDLKTRAEVLQWYLDLNSGGVVHTEEELDRVRQMLAEERKL